MNTLLIIEDDSLLNDGLAFALNSDGFTVIQAYNGEQAKVLLAQKPDLIVLDINLPDGNGRELCSWIRENTDTPVIFLTALGNEHDIVNGFKAGADDYITKPFSLPVLKQRIKAVLKRSAVNTDIYAYGNLTFDFAKLILTKNGTEISLTPTEIKLITLFLENRGKVLTRARILERVWDIDGDFVDENAVNVNIKRLRNKLEDDPSHPFFIRTVFGIGYLWGEDR